MLTWLWKQTLAESSIGISWSVLHGGHDEVLRPRPFPFLSFVNYHHLPQYCNMSRTTVKHRTNESDVTASFELSYTGPRSASGHQSGSASNNNNGADSEERGAAIISDDPTPPPHASGAVETWRYPRGNLGRLGFACVSALVAGMNDGAVGVGVDLTNQPGLLIETDMCILQQIGHYSIRKIRPLHNVSYTDSSPCSLRNTTTLATL